MKNLMELIKMAKGETRNDAEASVLLSAFGPPPENFKPTMQLPVQNDMPSFSIAQKGIGGVIAGQTHGVLAPLFGKGGNAPPSLGELLVGESNATD